MVYLTTPEGIEKKYACIKCIKGHRSSKCTHSDRELIEIKKKGRPVSQCENCRLLRKTRQVHVKCKCFLKTDLLESQLPIQPSQPPSQPQLQFHDWQQPLQTNSANEDALIASTSCIRCSRPKLYCICSLSRRETPVSSSSSEGSLTPPVYNTETPSSSSSSAGLTVKQKLNLRHLIIPIHDPSDDIDSDTPIYKPNREEQVDKKAVLGDFSNKSSEELMDQIYSGFRPECSLSGSPHLKDDEDDTLIELSKQDSL